MLNLKIFFLDLNSYNLYIHSISQPQAGYETGSVFKQSKHGLDFPSPKLVAMLRLYHSFIGGGGGAILRVLVGDEV